MNTTTLNHKEIYDSLVKLCDGTLTESFQRKEQLLDGILYVIFAYHIANYTDFTHPCALEARGIMFKYEEGKDPVLVCLPPKKFFNLYENPFTMDLKPENAAAFMHKEDGSLISSFLHNGKLALKSKTSLFSDQVKIAKDYLENTKSGQRLAIKLLEAANRGLTVNMELISPLNRIVLPYDTTSLVVLNVRSLETGKTYMPGDSQVLDDIFGIDWVEIFDIPIDERKAFIDEIPNLKNIEGYVIVYEDVLGITLAKHKTSWYQALHHTKDSITIPRRLFECIIEETVDDLKAMFHDDPFSMSKIQEMEDRIVPIFNHIRHTVDNFYKSNKELIRKEYAIKGMADEELKAYPGTFHLAMNLYLGKEADYKQFAIDNNKLFGINEIEEPKEVELADA